jgi:orotate phosphoribosyltransferase
MNDDARMDRSELAHAIAGVAWLRGSFRLRSGVESTEYFDKYRFEADPRLLAEGAGVAGRHVVVIEDVVTSGGQVVESALRLRELDAHVAQVLCVIDREAGGGENLHQHGLDLRTAFTMSELRRLRSPRSG